MAAKDVAGDGGGADRGKTELGFESGKASGAKSHTGTKSRTPDSRAARRRHGDPVQRIEAEAQTRFDVVDVRHREALCVARSSASCRVTRCW